MFCGRVGRSSATAANPSLVAVSCPSSSRYHRTRARNLTRLPAPLAVSLHRTVGGLVCAIVASPSLRRLGLHPLGARRPWRGADNTLSERSNIAAYAMHRRQTAGTSHVTIARACARLWARALSRCLRKDRTTRVGESRTSGGNRLLHVRCFSVAKNSPDEATYATDTIGWCSH